MLKAAVLALACVVPAAGFASGGSFVARRFAGGAAALSMSTSKQILDPMDIMHSKSMQDCPLRPYKTPEQNGGLEIATFALG